MVNWRTQARDDMLKSLSMPAVGETLTPEDCKKIAVTIANFGHGRVAPNPPVGAVIVDKGHRFLGAGFHERYGEAHAEIKALENANASPELLQDATIYVTLEPCAHHNQTPPCAERLAQLPLKEVIFGVYDPNPKVDGRGQAYLQERGIACRLDETWQHECTELAEAFLWNVKVRRPLVGLKTAADLGGMIARTGSERLAITGARSRRYGHFLRSMYDAVVVGVETLRTDNPRLDDRNSAIPGREPWKIVFDPTGRGFERINEQKLNLFCDDLSQDLSDRKVLWIVADDVPEPVQIKRLGASVLHLPLEDRSFNLERFLMELQNYRIFSILLEGGSGLYGPWLDAGLVQKLHLFFAMKVLGGSDKLRWTERYRVEGGHTLDEVTLTPLGDDLLLEGRFHGGATETQF